MDQTKQLYVRRASAGSGKTFTLAAHYVALLMQGEDYRRILAVTFTNKATAEMKERILGYLYAIANYTQHSATQGFLKRVREISKELGYKNELTDAYCAEKAQEKFADILANYDSMRVQTIDAFLQSLLAGMVQMLGGSVGYQVELDSERIISDAVDYLFTEGAKDGKIKTALTTYMHEQMDDEKNWNVRSSLCEIGKEIYKELLQEHSDQLEFDDQVLKQFKQSLDWRKTAPIDDLKAMLAKVTSWDAADFKNSNWYFGRFKKWNDQVNTRGRLDKDAFEDFSPSVIKALDDPSFPAYKGANASAVSQNLIQLRDLVKRCRQALLRDILLTAHLNDLVLMGALKERIEITLKENNSRLLAETAAVLSKALKTGDADFVLEKAGIRYKHIMLDEFQDTSSLQWDNFQYLLTELLSSMGGSTLIVGDIKQSIYRWRNGNWEIMQDLKEDWEDYYNTGVKSLVCNFRSEKEVIHFNLETFKHIAEQEDKEIQDIYEEGYDGTNLSEYYRKGHENGYVEANFYACPSRGEEKTRVRAEMVNDMFLKIEQLLERGVAASDMMILVRQNKETQEVMKGLIAMQTAEGHEWLKKVSLVSNSCFQLGFSPSVCAIVGAMRYVFFGDGVGKEYVGMVCPDAKWDESRVASYRTMALTDLAETLISELILKGEKQPSDLAYINSFRDQLRSYVRTNGSDGKRFITYWDDKMSEKTIPGADANGIRLMTIHASKGLEAANVFIPFCDWEMEEDRNSAMLWCEANDLIRKNGKKALLPIKQCKDMNEIGFANEYAQEHHLQRIDNLNLLYVAFTRAAERLYIYSDTSKMDDERTKWDVGQLLAERCGKKDAINQLCGEKKYEKSEPYNTQGDELWEIKRDDTPQKKEESKPTEPFSFASAEEETAECVSSSDHIEFRQSTDSRKYGWNVASMVQNQPLDNQSLGILCHELLAELRLYASTGDAVAAVKNVVVRAYERGIIPNDTIRNEVENLLVRTVSNAEMAQWFTGEGRVYCEQSVLFLNDHNEVEERRLDRVIWRTPEEAVVVDYKFGGDDKDYDKQVRHYMNICRQMGAKHIKGLLWLSQEERVKVVDSL